MLEIDSGWIIIPQERYIWHQDPIIMVDMQAIKMDAEGGGQLLRGPPTKIRASNLFPFANKLRKRELVFWMPIIYFKHEIEVP